MKATLPAESVENGFNYSPDKEMIDTFNVVVYHRGVIINPVTLRLYMGRSRNASTVYASLWCNEVDARDPDTYHAYSGRGNAGGGGYCKRSAAAGGAIRSAGIALSEPINGRGEGAICDALESIARAMGYRKLTIIRN